MTTFTRGGHGFGTEEGLTQTGMPQHVGQDGGATMHTGGSAQHAETNAAAGMLGLGVRG